MPEPVQFVHSSYLLQANAGWTQLQNLQYTGARFFIKPRPHTVAACILANDLYSVRAELAEALSSLRLAEAAKITISEGLERL